MAGGDPIPIGATAIKPVERHGLEAISWFLYDKNTGAIMGRTLISWLKITVFYIIYYGLLTGFWALMLFIFFQTLPEDRIPKWIQNDGIIGQSPALGVRPGQSYELIDSSMIIFNMDRETKASKEDVVPGYGEWANRTKTFLKPYSKEPKPSNLVDCSKAKLTNDAQFCKFDISVLSGCAGDNFGYDKGQPCIILKLNKIFGLIPQYCNDTKNLPEKAKDMPETLKKRINAVTTKNKNQVWVECHGENAADQESLGPIKYFPREGGFPSTYFPFLNQKGYHSPLVAVKFMKPKVGQFLHVECRAWAGNIGYHKRDRIGRAHFELMVHNATTAIRVENAAKGIVE